jgi:hypothetical protein
MGISSFAFQVFKSEPGFVFYLDYANLLFHEAGHPAAELFSQHLEVYGAPWGN